MYSLPVLEAISLKSVSLGQNQGVGRATLSLAAVGENSFITSFQLLVASRILWLMAASLQPLLSLSHLFLFLWLWPPCLPLINAFVIRIRFKHDCIIQNETSGKQWDRVGVLGNMLCLFASFLSTLNLKCISRMHFWWHQLQTSLNPQLCPSFGNIESALKSPWWPVEIPYSNFSVPCVCRGWMVLSWCSF